MSQLSKISLAVITALTLSACGSDSNDEPTNSAPTDITISASVVDENAVGATVGTLSATDADANDTFTFSTSDDRFVINGATLSLASEQKLNFESTPSVDVEVTVTDSGSESLTKTLTIDVNDLLDFYGFESAFISGESSVSYSGQTSRHLLINDLSIFINANLGNANDFDTSTTFTTGDDVRAAIASYFEADFNEISGRTLLTTTEPAAQTTLLEVSSSSKNLVGKVAGNDAVGQHRDWNTLGMAGIESAEPLTPEAYIRALFDELADNAQSQLDGVVRQDPFGDNITTIYLAEDGRDLKQLIQKFLLMSIGFSQGADDYLDDDIEGKGLMSDHTSQSGDSNYTALEHQFDEGFGYFGAARDFLDYSDDEIASKGGRDDWQGHHDTDGDGMIDFKSEFNFGQAVNAAKRDRGATVATNLTKNAMDAFLAGRQLLSETAGTELTTEQMETLKGHRDVALDAWEKSISATVVHYINDTISDLSNVGTDDFSYSDLAKHWSEMKAFALGLQFNRRSPVSETNFETLHSLMGDAPVLIVDDIPAYISDLEAARDILQAAYEFDADNVANW